MTLKELFVAMVFIFSPIIAFSAEPVKVILSQKRVEINESFSILFSTQEKIIEKPDFSPLMADFDILSTSQASNLSLINGAFNQEMRWTLVVMAKREGKLTIPSIQFGQHSSLPVTLDVQGATANNERESLFLETELQPSTAVYEQTQLIYTIRLYRTVHLAQATLSDVKINDPDAVIEKLGEDHEYEYDHPNGRQYRVLERKYAVFPHQTGELIFSPILFEGKVLKGGHSFFNPQGSYKRVSSGTEKVTVKPIPFPFQKHNWFAANDVALVGEWSADPNNVTLGEPITWTLTVTGEGCLGNQIPDIPLQLPPDVKQYPDKPEVSNQLKGEGYLGIKKTKIVFIPSKEGEMILPEVTFKWWDLKADKLREATLPPTSLRVHDRLVAMSPPSVIQEVPSPQETQQELSPSPQFPSWVWSLIGWNVLLMGALLLLVWKTWKRNEGRVIKRRFKRACLANDAVVAGSALLAWAERVYPQEKPLNLLSIKELIPDEFQEALNELYHALYGKQHKWTGGALWKGFIGFKRKKLLHAAHKKGFLRGLYPSENKTN